MNDTSEIQQLFSKLEQIDSQFKKEEDIKKEKFNIFSILRKQSEEVGLHSRFLAELLNPNASHKMPIFQQLFIDLVVNPTINQTSNRQAIDSNENFSCNYEVKMGKNGRVDIVLKNSNRIIVIENKIYAGDQKGQLKRYFNACKDAGYQKQDIYILYLNRYGDEISNWGKGDLNAENFMQINYKNDIATWIDACITEVKSYPHIEQTLIQYRRIIGNITGDTRNAKMKRAYIELLSEKNNFKLAYQLSNSFESFQLHIQRQIWNELIEALKQKEYKFVFCDNSLREIDRDKAIKKYFDRGFKPYGIKYVLGTFNEFNVNCYIALNECIYFSITLSNNIKRIEYPDSCNELCDSIENLHNDWEYPDNSKNLPAQLYPKQRLNLKNPNQVFFDIIDDDKRKQWIENTSNQIIKFMEDVKGLQMLD